VTVEPPLSVGGVKLTTAPLLVFTKVMPVVAPGAVGEAAMGVITDGEITVEPEPTALMAVTEKV
jgi:hypothetical protein